MLSRLPSVAIVAALALLTVPALAQEDRNHGISKIIAGNKTPLRPLMHKGKPIFPIGAYGVIRNSKGGFVSYQTLAQAGWNVVMSHPGKDFAKTHEKYSLIEKAGLAVIVDYNGWFRQQSQQEKQNILTNIRGVHNHPAILGYYMFDEPENILWNCKEYQDVRKKIGKSAALAGFPKFVDSKLSWMKPEIKKIAPNHYVFMCIAWWDCYSKLQHLVDVNLPNSYPTRHTKKEFEGPHAQIIYDAAMAAHSAKQQGNLGFCFTPMAIDIHSGGLQDYRSPTVSEFRYSAFAPITQGAMGCVFWAAYRCTDKYAEEVIFPVTKELKELTPFFLGQWMDQYLRVKPTDTNETYLKKYGVPRISACVRRAEDGRILLLAVNNTAQETKATLLLNKKGLPNQAVDFISKNTVKVTNGRIVDTLGPFAVKAYILAPDGQTK